MVLNGLPSIGFCNFQKIFALLGGELSELFTLSLEELVHRLRLSPAIAGRIGKWYEFFDLDDQLRRMETFGARFVPYCATDYPAQLKELRYPPIGIFLAGKPLPAGRAIAVVGTRRCSFEGERRAYDVSKILAQEGVASISGLARGIDMAAHGGTLAGGGHTVAVLGCGLDVIYPPENAGLYETILRDGTLISEFSFGRPADRQSFAIRNRIITGLADAVLVVESPISGGSMLSAQRAMEQRKPLFAIPGDPANPAAEGCRLLIRNGSARPIRSAEELLETIAHPTAKTSPVQLSPIAAEEPLRPELTVPEMAVWEQLAGGGPQTADEVAPAISLAVLECAQILQLFCVRGWARRELSGAFALSSAFS